jgi:lipopolysaccharide/colanic/teichoic acid biosynthesis glycosyltransferase
MTRARSDVVGGDLAIDGFIHQKSPSIAGQLRRLFGRLVISPTFLIASLFILYFVPESLLRARRRSHILSVVLDGIDTTIDFAVSLCALVLLSPLFLLVGILIKLESKGPVFYCQERIGKNHRNNCRKVWLNFTQSPPMKERRNGDLCGRPFKLYKFRTMRADAELHTGPIWAQEKDPRVTRVGKLLRITYIDEIPQLINVLRGDMSLVGPRPERPYFTGQLKNKISDYAVRFCVKPGITGLAQVKRYSDVSVEDVRRKLKYDIFYCQKRGLLLKIRIMAITGGWALKRVVASRGNCGRRR